MHYERAIIYFISINMKDIKTLPLIGFIGQGFIGKNYADDAESRGYSTVRYALEEPYRANKDAIKDCDIVFIAVPTPSTPNGFDASIIEKALSLIGEGKIVVIKSTVVPGTTKRLQKMFPKIIILMSPEFLSEATAASDSANPFSNIVGVSEDTEKQREAAARVHAVLPKAKFSSTCASDEAELIKYTHNLSGYMQIMLFNMMYDAAQSLGCDWQKVQDAAEHDPLICNRYARPIHKTGRGAGGHCFIKDMAAFREFMQTARPDDTKSIALLLAAEQKNIELLKSTKKDLDLLKGVYGNI